MFRELRAAPASQFSGAVRIPSQPAPRSTTSRYKHILHIPNLTAKNAGTENDYSIAFNYWKTKPIHCLYSVLKTCSHDCTERRKQSYVCILLTFTILLFKLQYTLKQTNKQNPTVNSSRLWISVDQQNGWRVNHDKPTYFGFFFFLAFHKLIQYQKFWFCARCCSNTEQSPCSWPYSFRRDIRASSQKQ